MLGFLLGLSAVGIIAAFLFASEATLGAVIIGAAAVLAVYARILQADLHHKETKKMLVAGLDLTEVKD